MSIERSSRHFVLATAGPVDHGKSALVKAWTGIDPDRGWATTSELRQALGTRRGVVLPLLEHSDKKGVTRREGDKRALKNMV